tara:strand:+ start:229 stop:1149 length:921 start_codon:yes stop_codon:yes gene_type:complete
MKNSLSEKGLSMSSAASISNLCNQRANDISAKLENLNNESTSFKAGGDTFEYTSAHKLPENVVGLLTEKAKLHGAQAFLVYNIKVKEALIKVIQQEILVSSLEKPEGKEMAQGKFLKEVDEDWGKSQLKLAEVNEFLHEESMAAHYGQFIHKNSILENLRKDINKPGKLEFVSLKDGERTPIKVERHHTAEQLAELHEEISVLHRDSEKRVNYFKAKIKNLVTLENASIARDNAKEQSRVNDINEGLSAEYTRELAEWSGKVREEKDTFEADRNVRLIIASKLRIEVSPLFKELIDKLDSGDSGNK